MMKKTPPFYIITGPPGSGKTTLIAHLQAEVSTVPEPARRVLAEQRRIGGTATGEQDPEAFISEMLALSVQDYDTARGPTLFDRGLPDLLAFTAYYQLPDADIRQAIEARRYHPTVFVLPSWEAIYRQDDERRLDFDGARAFGELTQTAYLEAGYKLVEVPKVSLAGRADFILDRMDA